MIFGQNGQKWDNFRFKLKNYRCIPGVKLPKYTYTVNTVPSPQWYTIYDTSCNVLYTIYLFISRLLINYGINACQLANDLS